MDHHLKNDCEGVDASVFSGDVLWDDDSRNELKEYIGRWTRAIAKHEGMTAEQRCSGCDIANGCPEFCRCKPAAVQAAQPEAVGWKLVPIKPTVDMLTAMSGEWHPSRHDKARKQYAEMLSAVPVIGDRS